MSLNKIIVKYYRLIRFLYFYLVMGLSYVYFKTLGRGIIVGAENIPKNESFIIAANHSSYLDWMVLYAFFKFTHKIDVSFLATHKLFVHPFWRYLMYSARCIEVPEKRTVKNSRILINKLRRSNSVVGVFPEGTRSADGKLMQAHSGIFNIALKKKCPILPIGLVGFYEAWPRHSRAPKIFSLKKMSINVGQIVYPKGQLKDEVLNDVMDDIASLSGQVYER